jgi:hypothetical protein
LGIFCSLLYFMAIGNFGTFCGPLLYVFSSLWYVLLRTYFPHFGIFYLEQSGTPASIFVPKQFRTGRAGCRGSVRVFEMSGRADAS